MSELDRVGWQPEKGGLVLKIQCPKCEKGEKSELVDVLSGRRYRLRCSNCGFTYILAGDLHKEKRLREATLDSKNGLLETFGP